MGRLKDDKGSELKGEDQKIIFDGGLAMPRPKVFDYDPASDETIVTQGVQGAAVTWVGIDVDGQTVHIVCNEGSLNTAGDGIEQVTRSRQQETLEGQEAIDFYTANKTAIDALIEAALETWAARRSKTGSVIIS